VSEAQDERTEQDRRAGVLMTAAVFVVSIFLFLGKVAGYVKEAMLSDYWGLSGGLDAFKVVYNSIVFLVYSKAEKLLRPTYLPIFVRHRDKDREDEAWRFFSITASLSFLALLAIAGLCTAFAPGIIRLGWPRMEPASANLAASLLRISAGAMLLLVMSVMAELTLHAYKRFTAPALADAVMRCALPVAIFGLVSAWGMTPADGSTGVSPQALRAAAIGLLIGSALRLLVQLPALWRRLKLCRPSLDVRNPDVVRMVKLMPPIIVGLVFSSARTFFDSRFSVDAGEGVYTALDFARKISDAPILILPLAVSLVVYPFVSEWASRENREMFARSLVAMTRVMAFVFVPMAAGLIVLALPSIQLLYLGDGAFTVEDSFVVRRALIPYAAGIPFFAVEGSINKWYFALGDTATPNYVGAVAAMLHIAIAWFGVHVLRRNVGVIALALTASKGLKVIVLYAMLRRRLEGIRGREVLVFVLRLAVATCVMVVALVVTSNALAGMIVDAGRPQRAIFLALCSGAGAVTYLAAAAALRIEEVGQVTGFVREKLARRLGRGQADAD